MKRPRNVEGVPEELDILIVEDVVADAVSLEAELRRAGLRVCTRRVERKEDFIRELESRTPNIVLSDFSLPNFDGLEALRVLQQHRPEVPFILVTSPRSEEVAVECLHEGAADYILKSSLRRLPSAVLAALEKRGAEVARVQAEASLRGLPRLILNAQEAERRRVARELHDSVNQILSSAKFRLEALAEQLAQRDADAVGEAVKTKDLIARAITEIRRISRNLRPSELDDLGLAAALRSLAGDFRERTGIELNLVLGELSESLPDDIELNAYRIVQEAFNNIEKHSGARRAEVTLRQGAGLLCITIRDDGCGFDSETPPRLRMTGPGMGLVDMKERASFLGGLCRVASAPGRGTTVRAEIPIPAVPAGIPVSREKRSAEKGSPAAGR